MFQRFHKMREEDERGFTLIELLVVILIIAILAAIAIPVFLRQREKGWRSQMQSALKNAATAQESYATGNNGQYTTTEGDLDSEGLNYASAVTLDVDNGDATTYEMTATHDQLDETWCISSTTGEPVEATSC